MSHRIRIIKTRTLKEETEMKRRGFLQILFGLAGASATLANASSQQITATQKPILLQETSIAGFQFYEGERLFNHMKINDTVRLHRAPENQYDKRAVEVYWQGNMLGHIPKAANMNLSQMLDNGITLDAKVCWLMAEKMPFYCVGLAVTINNTLKRT
jgi:hypothetical protein